MCNKMTKRVALAIEIAIVEKTAHHPIKKFLPHMKWLWPIVAQAVLAAMREPTRDVLVAGIKRAEDIEDETCDSEEYYRLDHGSDYPHPVWQAMIDAALAEK